MGESLGRAGDGIRTLDKESFEGLRTRLLEGSKEITSPDIYEGKWYQRSDGTIIGVRESVKSGTTLDVVDGANSGLRKGYKVHLK